jgi:deoxyhypusine synthase
MDFFEALGFRHYQAQSNVDDRDLRDLYIDRIYDTYIDEEELNKAATMLGFPFRNKEHLKAKFKEIDADGNGKITETEFIEWWNTRSTKGTRKLAQMISLTAESEVALEKSLWPEAKK